jgi:hypothetical protein
MPPSRGHVTACVTPSRQSQSKIPRVPRPPSPSRVGCYYGGRVRSIRTEDCSWLCDRGAAEHLEFFFTSRPREETYNGKCVKQRVKLKARISVKPLC